jgi:hypothetical protein
VLVNGIEAWIELAHGGFPLSTQHYVPDIIHPRAVDHIVAFALDPWPTWTFRTRPVVVHFKLGRLANICVHAGGQKIVRSPNHSSKAIRVVPCPLIGSSLSLRIARCPT